MWEYMGRAFLIRPRWDCLRTEGDSTYNRILFPLSLAYCASLLKRQGIPTRLYDFQGMRGLDVKEELSDIKLDDAVFVTSSDIDRWQCPHLYLEPFLSIVNLVRQMTEKVFLIGPHGTMAPDMLLQLTQAKAVIRGEPEGTVLRLALGENLKSIPGISYVAEGTTFHNPDCEDVNLNELPFPDLSLLKSANYSYEIFGDRLALFESSRNCPFSCTFCYKGMYGKRYRLKSVGRMIEEIKQAMRLGMKRGDFIDLDIGINRSHLVNLCRAMKENVPYFEWCCQTKIDNLDEEVISLMAQAGCKLIQFGIESADQQRLRNLRKNVDFKKVKPVLAICRRKGIQTLGFLIVGFPGESLEEAQRTLDLGLELSPTYLSIHLLTAFKGTPFYNTNLGSDRWAYLEPSLKKRNQLEKMKLRTYLRHYLRLSTIREQFVLNRLPSVFSRLKFFLNYIR